MRPLLSTGAALALAAGLAACPGREEARAPAPPISGKPAPALAAPELEQVMGSFLSRHWRRPLAPQGEAPAGFTEVDRSLDPVTCGACHPKQLAEWQTSLHSAAFGPGFSGQLIEGPLATPAGIRSCQECHAPLAEQQPVSSGGRPESAFDPSLRAHGVVCAACHIRRYRVYGPPRRPGVAPAPSPVPHGGFEVREEYLDSRFCAACHQFFDDAGVNGKPLENTYAEWKASPQAAEGRHCQICHMPDRVHHWRGIHDPEIVRAAVDVDLVELGFSTEALEAALVLRNRDVGHAFPTYVTPRVTLAVVQADREGREIPGTRMEATVGREVDLGTMTEIFDTRVLPGESVKLDYRRERSEGAATLVGRVTVDPDFHYRGVFEALLARYRSPGARARMTQALERISASRYVLAEIRRSLPAR